MRLTQIKQSNLGKFWYPQTCHQFIFLQVCKSRNLSFTAFLLSCLRFQSSQGPFSFSRFKSIFLLHSCSHYIKYHSLIFPKFFCLPFSTRSYPTCTNINPVNLPYYILIPYIFSSDNTCLYLCLYVLHFPRAFWE